VVTGRSASCYPSFHYIPLRPPSSGSSYILRSPSVITPLHCRQFFANEELPPSRSSIFTTSGSVLTTSSRIAAASARDLPAHAAHLSGWTHRLRPTALRAGPCTQQPHSALVRSTAPSHITSPLANHWPYSTRSQAPRLQFKGTY
jgi:hypothetical protein